jgi:hypothetical protein
VGLSPTRRPALLLLRRLQLSAEPVSSAITRTGDLQGCQQPLYIELLCMTSNTHNTAAALVKVVPVRGASPIRKCCLHPWRRCMAQTHPPRCQGLQQLGVLACLSHLHGSNHTHDPADGDSAQLLQLLRSAAVHAPALQLGISAQ